MILLEQFRNAHPVIYQFGLIFLTLPVAKLLEWLLKLALRPIKNRIPATPPVTRVYELGRFITFYIIYTFLLSAQAVALSQLQVNNDFVAAIARFTTIWIFYRTILFVLTARMAAEQKNFWDKKLLRPMAIFVALLHAGGLLDNVLGWGFYFDTLNFTLTVGGVLLATAVVSGFAMLGNWLRDLLTSGTLSESGLPNSTTQSLGQISTYVLLTLGLLIALATLGLDLSAITVILGGASVGIAFGLQEIINNFTSGFILLFERSVVPGDIVQVDNNTGQVKEIGIRATTINTLDNIDMIIPNSYFLSQVVTNMTHTEALIRLKIDVGASYSADPRKIEATLLSVATKHPDVQTTPAPSVQFTNFGESSIDFRLLVWTVEAVSGERLKSQLRYTIWEAFAENGIEIPFPQRDLHLRSGWPD